MKGSKISIRCKEGGKRYSQNEQHRLHSARFHARQRISCEVGCTSAVVVYDLRWVAYGPKIRSADYGVHRSRASIVSGTISLDGETIVVIGRWVFGELRLSVD